MRDLYKAFLSVYFMSMLNFLYRGKYRPPNAPPDGEKPLYLHISAAAHVSII
jgi:hypothetical protein